MKLLKRNKKCHKFLTSSQTLYVGYIFKKNSGCELFIDNIEEQTFKAEVQFKGHSSIILFKRNEKLKIFLFSLKWIQGKLKKINIKTLI